MKIAILGTGNVGSALGRAWAGRGHEIAFGTRNPQDARVRGLLAELGDPTRAGTPRDASEGAEVVLLATPWPAARETLASCGDLAGKVLIDCTNPLLPDLSALEIGHTTSAAEHIAGWAPGARVVKAFNSVAAGDLGRRPSEGAVITGFYCGDDGAAKRIVHDLVEAAGLSPLDVGPLDKARHLEAFAMFWIHLLVGRHIGRDTTLTLVSR